MTLRQLVPTGGEYEFPGGRSVDDLIAHLSDGSDATYEVEDGGSLLLHYSPADFVGATRVIVKARWAPEGGSASISLELFQTPWPGAATGGDVFTITPEVSTLSEYAFDTDDLPGLLDEPDWSGWVFPTGGPGSAVRGTRSLHRGLLYL